MACTIHMARVLICQKPGSVHQKNTHALLFLTWFHASCLMLRLLKKASMSEADPEIVRLQLRYQIMLIFSLFKALFARPATSLILSKKLPFGCVENGRHLYLSPVSSVMYLQEREHQQTPVSDHHQVNFLNFLI